MSAAHFLLVDVLESQQVDKDFKPTQSTAPLILKPPLTNSRENRVNFLWLTVLKTTETTEIDFGWLEPPNHGILTRFSWLTRDFYRFCQIDVNLTFLSCFLRKLQVQKDYSTSFKINGTWTWLTIFFNEANSFQTVNTTDLKSYISHF